jgi:beta-galactosidase
MSGMFIWTGFDYLGEPTPYGWPSRSSYFGVVDLAGFPKDTYFMYQSEWTGEDVLHVFPHWNWSEGDVVDIWTYSSSDHVELFLNGKSLGKKTKGVDDLHLMWRVPFEKGTITARSYDGGKVVLEKVIKTAEPPVKMLLTPDRSKIVADGRDLSFITVSVHDAGNTLHPLADNLIHFEVEGPGKIVGVDNGDPTSHLLLKGDRMKAFHGLCLVVVQSTGGKGEITLKASSEKIEAASVVLKAE